MGYKLVSDVSYNFINLHDYKKYIMIFLIVLIFFIMFKNMLLLERVTIGKIFRDDLDEHFINKLELDKVN